LAKTTEDMIAALTAIQDLEGVIPVLIEGFTDYGLIETKLPELTPTTQQENGNYAIDESSNSKTAVIRRA
jgi:hypothetical protein